MVKNVSFLYSGKDGQLGLCFSQLGPYAKEHDIELIGLGRKELDITDVDQVKRALNIHKPQVFFNFAAYTQVDLAESEPEKAGLVNCLGPAILAQECKKRNILLVHISTDYVFDGTKSGPYTVEDEPNPINVYGKTKLEGERAIAENTDEYLIIRTSWVFSRHGQNFFKTMIRLGKEKDELSIVDDQRGGPTYAPHLARFSFELALKTMQEKKGWGLYHFSGSPFVSWYEFAQAIFIADGKRAPKLNRVTSDKFITKASRPKNSCLQNNLNLSNNLWKEGIQEILEYQSPED